LKDTPRTVTYTLIGIESFAAAGVSLVVAGAKSNAYQVL
jgi:hypothetical protein